MLFNSYVFILLFLPVVLTGYFFLNKYQLYKQAILFLFVASLFFYGYWNIKYVFLILFSISINYIFARHIIKSSDEKTKKYLLWISIAINILLLAYYKYTNFFIANINHFISSNISFIQIILPLGISFFTFTQIAFLVDAYRNKVKNLHFFNYGLFVTYFPHLLAGPIIHHAEIMPQFENVQFKNINYKNIVIGLMVFSIGLFKKTCIADTLGDWVNSGYTLIQYLSTPETWLLTLSYTLQLYFDFSGYVDMAIGCSLMFNIKLPENFNSPYKALNIQDFWRRWHMTLSRWLRDYLYIPLGGNKQNELKNYFNLFVTFLLGGLWHGAGWTYIIWGSLHGSAMIAHRLWKKMEIQIPNLLAWFITFMFVNIAWVFFRSDSITQALFILRKMLSFSFIQTAVSLKDFLSGFVPFHLDSTPMNLLFIMPLFLGLCFFSKNSLEIKLSYVPTLRWNIFIAGILAIGLMCVIRQSTFIYFQF